MYSRKEILSAAVMAVTGITIAGIWTDNFFIVWLGWGLVFCFLETAGLSSRRKGDTLSEQVWLGTRSKSLGWRIVWLFGTVTLLLWLIFHFITGLALPS